MLKRPYFSYLYFDSKKLCPYNTRLFDLVKKNMAFEALLDTKKIESTPWYVKEQTDESKFTRLAEVSESGRSTVELDVNLYRDAEQVVQIEGSASATLTLICQKCLEQYEAEIDLELKDAFKIKSQYSKKQDYGYSSEEAEKDDDDNYFDSEGHFRLLDYIEDEILLAVPVFPAHPNEEDCDHTMIERLKEKHEAEGEVDNPFAVLKNLK